MSAKTPTLRGMSPAPHERDGEPAASHTREIAALRAAYAALNRGDVDGFVAGFDSGVVRIEEFGFPTAGAYTGLEAVREHVSRGRGTWAEGACEPERFVVAGERVVVVARVRVWLTHETAWREGRIADVFTFEGGKVAEYRTFGDVAEGLAWAGAGEAGAR
jgi:ketosteroid isomerase-like protein